MKIVEKKCPNCGANLDFKVGERDVTCAHCRRKYAVEYDGVDFSKLSEDAVNALKDIDINLIKPFAKFFKVYAGIIFGIAIVGIIFVFTILIFSFKSERQMNEEYQQQVQESQEEYQQRVQESQKEYQRNVQESQEEYNRQVEEMNREHEEFVNEYMK